MPFSPGCGRYDTLVDSLLLEWLVMRVASVSGLQDMTLRFGDLERGCDGLG
jgi:hypothetical protein